MASGTGAAAAPTVINRCSSVVCISVCSRASRAAPLLRCTQKLSGGIWGITARTEVCTAWIETMRTKAELRGGGTDLQGGNQFL